MLIDMGDIVSDIAKIIFFKIVVLVEVSIDIGISIMIIVDFNSKRVRVNVWSGTITKNEDVIIDKMVAEKEINSKFIENKKEK